MTIAALGARATQVAELTGDAAGRGTGRESGPFVALVIVSMLSSLGVGIVAPRRRRVGEPASLRTAAPTVAGSSPPSPAEWFILEIRPRFRPARPSQQGRLKEALSLQGWTIVHPESRTKILLHTGNMWEVEDAVSRRVGAGGTVNGFAGLAARPVSTLR